METRHRGGDRPASRLRSWPVGVWWAAFGGVLAVLMLMPVDRPAFVALLAASGATFGVLRPFVGRAGAGARRSRLAVALLMLAMFGLSTTAAELSSLPPAASAMPAQAAAPRPTRGG